MTKPPRSQATRERILAAARREFAREGFEGATIRAIAEAAGVHASMVMRYYESKERLFALSSRFDLRLPDLRAAPPGKAGEVMVRHFLATWDGDEGELPALLRLAVTHQGARAQLLALFTDQVEPALRQVMAPGDMRERAALISTQVLGLAFGRYVLRFDPIAALEPGIIVQRIGAVLQGYIDG